MTLTEQTMNTSPNRNRNNLLIQIFILKHLVIFNIVCHSKI